MNDNHGLGSGVSEQNIFPDALTEPEGGLLRAVFRGALFTSRLARAPGGWRTLSIHELNALGLSDDDREAVLSLQELVQRSYPVLLRHKIVNSTAVASVYGHRLGSLMHEVMLAIALDGLNHFLAEVTVGMGGAHRLAVQPRDVIRPLIREGASAFILLHNHPSGDPTPSPEDLAMTRTMVECASAIGVPMIDHVIIGGRGGGYRSLLDLGVIEPRRREAEMNKEILCRPFPPELVKHREGQNGKMLSYLETHVVIERLNEGCDAWSFEVVQHHVYKVEVVVVGKLTADGVIKMAFGGSAITFNNAGKVVSLADDLKAAASDALKKAASMLGVGLELYARRSATAGQPARPCPDNAGHSQRRLDPASVPAGDVATQKQISAISGICRRKNVSRERLVALIEQRTGKCWLNELTRREASRLLSELANLNGAHP